MQTKKMGVLAWATAAVLLFQTGSFGQYTRSPATRMSTAPVTTYPVDVGGMYAPRGLVAGSRPVPIGAPTSPPRHVSSQPRDSALLMPARLQPGRYSGLYAPTNLSAAAPTAATNGGGPSISQYYFANPGHDIYLFRPNQPSYSAYAPPGVSLPSQGTPVYTVTYAPGTIGSGEVTIAQGSAGFSGFGTPAIFGQPTYTNTRPFFGQGLNVFNTPGTISYGQSTQAWLTPPGYFGNTLPTGPSH